MLVVLHKTRKEREMGRLRARERYKGRVRERMGKGEKEKYSDLPITLWL